jgi:hypothetical protein
MTKPSDIKPIKKANDEVEEPKTVKKPYIRPPHLTQKPLQDNPALRDLQSALSRKTQGNYKIRKR